MITRKKVIDIFIEGYVCVMFPLFLALYFWLWVACVAYENESYLIAFLGGLSGGYGAVLLSVLLKKQLNKIKIRQQARTN